MDLTAADPRVAPAAGRAALAEVLGTLGLVFAGTVAVVDTQTGALGHVVMAAINAVDGEAGLADVAIGGTVAFEALPGVPVYRAVSGDRIRRARPASARSHVFSTLTRS